MKNQYWIICILVLISTSCIETSGKYKKLLAEHDSMVMQNKSLEQGYNEAFTLLNQVEEGFDRIRSAQGGFVVKMKSQQKDKYVNQRQLITAEMNFIETLIKENRKRINSLQSRLNEALAKNPAIQSTVDRLQKQITEDQQLIDSMRTIIGKRDFTIADMNRLTNTLNQSISELEKNLANSKSTELFLNQELNELNLVYYCVLPYKQLKSEGIIKGGGLFSKPKLSVDPLGEQPALYKQIDMRKLSSVVIGTSKYQIMTPHPKDSYNISEDETGKLCLYILQSKLFWSKSKVLVVSQQ